MSRSAKFPSKAKYSALFAGETPSNDFPSAAADSLPSGPGDTVIRDVMTGPSSQPVSPRPSVTLTLSRKGLKVVKLSGSSTTTADGRTHSGRRRTSAVKTEVRHQLKDIVGVAQGTDPEIQRGVTLIIYGLNAETGSWLNTFVYWFDGVDQATRFAQHIRHYVDAAEHRNWIERLKAEMIVRGQLDASTSAAIPDERRLAASRSQSSTTSGRLSTDDDIESGALRSSSASTPDLDCASLPTSPRPSGDPSIDMRSTWQNHGDDVTYDPIHPAPDYDDFDDVIDDGGVQPTSPPIVIPRPVASLTCELRTRLAIGSPLLLPPKDYDTVNRTRGNLIGIERRRCLTENVVGRISVTYDDQRQGDNFILSPAADQRHQMTF